jgi:hypothetical protein
MKPCTRCPNRQATEGYNTCEHCRERQRRSNRKIRQKHIAAGLCLWCKTPALPGLRTCQDHKIKSKIWRQRKPFKKKPVKRPPLGTCVCGNQTSDAKYCSDCQQKKRRRTLLNKIITMQHYGGIKCSCPGCTETDINFLTIDHINGDGAKHRKEIGRSSLYNWLISNHFPPGFRVLCFNCNVGTYLCDGACPHTNPTTITQVDFDAAAERLIKTRTLAEAKRQTQAAREHWQSLTQEQKRALRKPRLGTISQIKKTCQCGETHRKCFNKSQDTCDNCIHKTRQPEKPWLDRWTTEAGIARQCTKCPETNPLCLTWQKKPQTKSILSKAWHKEAWLRIISDFEQVCQNCLKKPIQTVDSCT